jgi:FtsH-binding integral membrane protein
VKTPLRNKVVCSVFFALIGLVGGPLISMWLQQAFDLNDWAILLISLLYGLMVGTVAVFGYYELQETAARRRAKADEARLQARWEELRRGLS